MVKAQSKILPLLACYSSNAISILSLTHLKPLHHLLHQSTNIQITLICLSQNCRVASDCLEVLELIWGSYLLHLTRRAVDAHRPLEILTISWIFYCLYLRLYLCQRPLFVDQAGLTPTNRCYPLSYSVYDTNYLRHPSDHLPTFDSFQSLF